MSATMTAPEQVDGLEKLLLLASLKPQDIAASAEEARKQLQLTQAEEGKVAEAKSYIAKHVSLANDIQRREDELVANKAEHLTQVSNFATHVDAENKRLEEFSAELDERKKQLDAYQKRNEEAEQKIASERAAFVNQQNEAATTNTANANANVAMKTANETEKQRLTEWEAVLKSKAKAIREQAASF